MSSTIDTSGTAEAVLLLAARLLPAWLSYLALSSLFLAVWLHPVWIGWHAAAGLRSIVLLEVLGTAALTYFLSGRDEFLGWIPIPPLAAVLCIVLWSSFGPWAAIALPAHLVIRSIALWRDAKKWHEAFVALGLSAVVMVGVWLMVGLVPLPALGWSSTSTPPTLWWNVLGWHGWKRVPFGLPAWGCLYFFLTSTLQVFEVRWIGWIGSRKVVQQFLRMNR